MLKSANQLLAENLSRLMKERGFNDQSLGKKAGIAPNTVGNYTRGDVQITPGGKERSAKLLEVEKLAQALEVQVAELVTDATNAPQGLSVAEGGARYVVGQPENIRQLLDDLSDLPPARQSAFIDMIHQAAEEARAAAEHLARKRQPAMAAARTGSTKGSLTIRYGDGNPEQARLPLKTVTDPFNAEPSESEQAWYDQIERNKTR